MGDAQEGCAAGTALADIPDDWRCPDCGVRDQADFEPTDPGAGERVGGPEGAVQCRIRAPRAPRSSARLAMPDGGRGGPIRTVAAAGALTTNEGGAVTMARLAHAVGVSRQTVYNEFGTKHALAEAMILAELERFLAVVRRRSTRAGVLARRDRARDPRGCSSSAQDNRLLHAVGVGPTHRPLTELLPLLTTNAGSLLETAKEVVARAGRRRTPRRSTPRTSTPRSTWSSGSCSATSCSRRRRRSGPAPTSPGSPRRVLEG